MFESYESPITAYTQKISTAIAEKYDETLLTEVYESGFNVDKAELAKALEYDRDQYQKGYNDCFKYLGLLMDTALGFEPLTETMCSEMCLYEEDYCFAHCYYDETPNRECVKEWLLLKEKIKEWQK